MWRTRLQSAAWWLGALLQRAHQAARALLLEWGASLPDGTIEAFTARAVDARHQIACLLQCQHSRPALGAAAACGACVRDIEQGMRWPACSPRPPSAVQQQARPPGAHAAARTYALHDRRQHDGAAVGGDAAHGSEVKHYIYNEESPRTYYVYPGVSSASTVYLEIMYSKNPAVITTVTGSTALSVPDIFGNAVMNYVLYMAYMKDSEYAGNQQRAANHYQLFSASVTGKAQIDTVSSPNVEANNPPNLR